MDIKTMTILIFLVTVATCASRIDPPELAQIDMKE